MYHMYGKLYSKVVKFGKCLELFMDQQKHCLIVLNFTPMPFYHNHPILPYI